MNLENYRWSDDQRSFGPFIYARSPTYRHIAAVITSGDGGEYPGCRLRLTLSAHTIIISLPQIVRPNRRKVYPGWDAATVERLGRDWYYETTRRDFGFSYSEGFLQVFRGAVTHDSSTDRTWSAFLPWTQRRFVRHSLYGLDGALFADLPQPAHWGTPGYAAGEKMKDSCPVASFDFTDYDGERLTATTRIEEREWWLGEGWFKWLSLFSRPEVRRSLDIRFSDETGRRKGSWKGGAIGTGIEMLDGELHEAAFRRYCLANEMKFVGMSARLEQAP